MTIEDARNIFNTYAKWKALGFMDNLEPSLQMDLALDLEEMAKILIDDSTHKERVYNEKLDVIAFVALIGIVRKSPNFKLGNVEAFLNKLNDFFKRNDIIEDMKEFEMMDIDIEAEFVNHFIELTSNNYD
jgi:hypothetical protein